MGTVSLLWFSSFHVLYLNRSDDFHPVVGDPSIIPSHMLLLGSQEKGWPLGCLSRASLGPHLQVLFSVCLFETQTGLKRLKE